MPSSRLVDEVPELSWSATLRLFLGLLVAVVGLLFVAAFMLLYGVTAIGRWIGERVEYEEKILLALDVVVGVDRMRSFRDDMIEVVKPRIGNPHEHEMDNPQLRSEIERLRQSAKDDIRKGDFVIAVGSGLISLALSALSSLSFLALLVAVYGLLTTFLLTVRVVVTDVLAYSENELSGYETRKPKLVPMYAWNKAVLSSYQTQAGTIVVGLLKRFTPIGYELSLSLLDDVLERDLGLIDFGFLMGGALLQAAKDR